MCLAGLLRGSGTCTLGGGNWRNLCGFWGCGGGGLINRWRCGLAFFNRWLALSSFLPLLTTLLAESDTLAIILRLSSGCNINSFHSRTAQLGGISRVFLVSLNNLRAFLEHSRNNILPETMSMNYTKIFIEGNYL